VSIPQALHEKLKQGLIDLGEDPARHPCDKYLRFLTELAKWNNAYNLTAITEPGQMLTHHLLDSLSILPYIRGNRCLDVGTGAGLPGLVLALARPDTHWTLLDSKGKKVRFLQHVIKELQLDNVDVAHTRVEDYRPEQGFTTIVARALGNLADFHEITSHLHGRDCVLLAMKGGYPGDELAGISTGAPEVRKLVVPGLDAERHLVIMR
jgi:16S rRNA (guanine527-N7)-methyltransferase